MKIYKEARSFRVMQWIFFLTFLIFSIFFLTAPFSHFIDSQGRIIFLLSSPVLVILTILMFLQLTISSDLLIVDEKGLWLATYFSKRIHIPWTSIDKAVIFKERSKQNLGRGASIYQTLTKLKIVEKSGKTRILSAENWEPSIENLQVDFTYWGYASLIQKDPSLQK